MTDGVLLIRSPALLPPSRGGWPPGPMLHARQSCGPVLVPVPRRLEDQVSATMEDLFGEPIHIYTRKQAVEDGVLVLLPAQLSAEAGYGVSVAMTRAAFGLVEVPPSQAHCQDLTGRMWDVLWMARGAARASATRGGRYAFQVILRTARGRQKVETLHAVVDGDGLTIMLPEES